MIFTVTLAYQDKEYTYEHGFSETNGENMTAEELATYLYEEGNYACDCNRSDFINEHCDENFPEMGCGHTIRLLSLIKKEE